MTRKHWRETRRFIEKCCCGDEETAEIMERDLDEIEAALFPPLAPNEPPPLQSEP